MTTKFIGLEAHKDTIAVAAADGEGAREVRFHGTVANTPEAVRRLVARLSGSGTALRCCYEAGACGHGVHRQLQRLGVDCVVVRLMSWLGLAPPERSSGARVRRGAITKTGNGQPRTMLIEASWCYRLPAREEQRHRRGCRICRRRSEASRGARECGRAGGSAGSQQPASRCRRRPRRSHASLRGSCGTSRAGSGPPRLCRPDRWRVPQPSRGGAQDNIDSDLAGVPRRPEAMGDPRRTAGRALGPTPDAKTEGGPRRKAGSAVANPRMRA